MFAVPAPPSRLKAAKLVDNAEACAVCQEDDSRQDDLIIFCDGCDVAVHQVHVIPFLRYKLFMIFSFSF